MTTALLSINWGNALIVTIVGFGLVIVLLIVLVLVMKIFGWFFTHGTKAAPAAAANVAGGTQPQTQFLTDEELAAVSAAVNSCFFGVHDFEDLTITIHHDEQDSDWTSKYTALTQ